jgi:hypothetical protein
MQKAAAALDEWNQLLKKQTLWGEFCYPNPESLK